MLNLRRRMLGALAFILLVTLVGIVGFSIIDPDAGFIRGFFMTAITLTTVGYGEEIAVDTDGARVFTAILLLVAMGATLYFVSTGTAFLLEGEHGKVFRRRKMERQLASLEGHMIVCGAGSTAMYATRELHEVQRPVVMICPTKEEAEAATARMPNVPITLGDPTDDDILRAAGIERAFGLIACSEHDNENVVITLTGRQLNPRIRIVSRLSDVDTETKVRKVGANAVGSPQHIGGLRLASELIRPTVVTFLDKMLLDKDRSLRMDEITIAEGSASVGKAINNLGLEHVPGMLLLAIRSTDGDWEYNPRRSTRVRAGSVLVFLGTPEDSRSLRDRLDPDTNERAVQWGSHCGQRAVAAGTGSEVPTGTTGFDEHLIQKTRIAAVVHDSLDGQRTGSHIEDWIHITAPSEVLTVIVERTSNRRSGDDRRESTERRVGSRRSGQRRSDTATAVVDERRTSDRRTGGDQRSGSDRRVGDRRVMADRRMMMAFA